MSFSRARSCVPGGEIQSVGHVDDGDARPSHAQLALLIRNATKGHFGPCASIPHIYEQYA
jgi:hypothetical protein